MSIIKRYLRGIKPKKIIANICYSSPGERLLDKKIIVTGGSRGIGYAMAKKFKEEGAKVLITGRNEEALQIVSMELNCKYMQLDMTSVECFDRFVKEAESLLGGIDALVNNAGISLHEKTFFDVTPSSFDQQISTNLKGPFFLTQSFISYLLCENRKGSVLFISSETGFTADIRPYGYTKAAINSMVQGLAYTFAKDAIRINALAPGITATDMTGYSKSENLYCRQNMTERAYLPEEIAETACFLLSDISDCISGQIIVCNNGRTINSRIRK